MRWTWREVVGEIKWGRTEVSQVSLPNLLHSSFRFVSMTQHGEHGYRLGAG
jgi:hypothetical protein